MLLARLALYTAYKIFTVKDLGGRQSMLLVRLEVYTGIINTYSVKRGRKTIYAFGPSRPLDGHNYYLQCKTWKEDNLCCWSLSPYRRGLLIPTV